MRLDFISRILFIVYCVEAGAVFFFIPWGAAWDRTVVQMPSAELRSILLHPTFRSLITGFGIMHLIWAVNDIGLLLGRSKTRKRATG